MSSPDSNVVRKVAESIDSPSPIDTRHREDEIPSSIHLHRARLLRIDHEEAQLASKGCTWYEIKASTLRELDIPVIKDKAGISELYKVIVPRVEARDHRPPAGFHTF
ncbi:UBX domain-containing protein 6-like [Dorcoceras hygrometricum]|uniref:UBX domain-containing protein 6-like n=1 Tax=Dorcoceras hygrometricum TaxID=472368 RepID=A0A2Z6ZZ96_9LAMI|nr:UBX domain-containing protein 6-like [Dorcoceras hygrometricum]